MTRWPWITPVLAVAVAISPPGQDIIGGLWSGESITRDLSGFLLICGTAIALGLLAVEWIVRGLVARHQRRQTGDGSV